MDKYHPLSGGQIPVSPDCSDTFPHQTRYGRALLRLRKGNPLRQARRVWTQLHLKEDPKCHNGHLTSLKGRENPPCPRAFQPEETAPTTKGCLSSPTRLSNPSSGPLFPDQEAAENLSCCFQQNKTSKNIHSQLGRTAAISRHFKNGGDTRIPQFPSFRRGCEHNLYGPLRGEEDVRLPQFPYSRGGTEVNLHGSPHA